MYGHGLIYMRARYYSPDMKRFVNADVIAGEISNAVTLNRYARVKGNQLLFMDPIGNLHFNIVWNELVDFVEEKMLQTSISIYKIAEDAKNYDKDNTDEQMMLH